MSHSRRHEPSSEPVTAGPSLSIVIPTHNRSGSIRRVVERLVEQPNFESCELIVVDSRSTDDTPRTLKELSTEHPRIRALRCERPGAAAARNMGLDHAVGALTLFLDDDILVPSTFIEQLLSAHRQRPDVAWVARLRDDWAESKEPFLRYLASSGEVMPREVSAEVDLDGRYFFTGCVALPRATIGDLRFDEGFTDYGYEDTDFGVRLRAKGVPLRLADVEVIHDYHPDYARYREKRRRAGRSMAYYLAKHPERAMEYTLERRVDPMRRLLGIARAALAPFATLEWRLHRSLSGRYPLSPILRHWFRLDLNLQMYDGLKEGKAERSTLKQTPAAGRNNLRAA